MLISLVICTRNRCSILRDSLEYIERLQSPGEWELVLVDNGSTDGTSELMRDFAARSPFRVVLVSEPKPGLGGARNAGIANATGEIIAFTDDDCYVSADFLTRMLDVFQEERVGFMGGRILLYDEADLPLTLRTDTELQLIEPYTFIEAGWLQGANMAIRRSLVMEIGGFDPRFGKGSTFKGGEDVDLQARASQGGAIGVYHPGPVVWHHHRRKSREDYNSLAKEYGYCRGAYYAKFILNSPTRTMFAKKWYRRIKGHFRNRQFLDFLYEIAGAAHYSFVHLYGRVRKTALLTARNGKQPQTAGASVKSKT